MCRILKELKKLNSNSDHIKIRARKGKNKYSVYLDFYNQGKREYFYLAKGLHLSGLIKNLSEDLKKIEIIKAIRNQKQNELLQKETGFSLSKAKNFDIIYYWEQDKRAKVKTHSGAKKHLEKFLKKERFKHEFKFYNNFYQYLLENVKRNSANQYLTVFGSIINKAIKEEILEKNYIAQIQKKKEDTMREFLTETELLKLIDTPCENNEIKNAFIFSCFTALRLCDIQTFKFNKITENHIRIKMQKTKDGVRLKLVPRAIKIIEEQRKLHNTYMFHLPKGNTNINNHIQEWVDTAGIKKHITFHCARHTFATLMLSRGADIYTVSKLLGHTSVSTTEIYLHLIDKKRDETMDLLNI